MNAHSQSMRLHEFTLFLRFKPLERKKRATSVKITVDRHVDCPHVDMMLLF